MSFCAVRAQEFRCSVQVNYQKLLTTTQAYESANDKKVFDAMKQAIEDFVNGRRWTNIDFEQQEQLDCGISLILSTRSSATDFAGQLQIQLRRPVYNSTYTSGLFNYMESGNFNFTFNESQPLDFDLGNFYSNLSSTLGYYCYLLLGSISTAMLPAVESRSTSWHSRCSRLPKVVDMWGGRAVRGPRAATGLWRITPTRPMHRCIRPITTTTAWAST